MKRIAGAAALAAILLAPSSHAADAPTGRWYKECGGDIYCRILVEKAGPGSFKFHFMTTSPSSDESCEWISTMTLRDDGKLASSDKKTRFEAWVDASGALMTTGKMPAKCGARPAEDAFKPDDADENGDL
jgi:hypothetical protein